MTQNAWRRTGGSAVAVGLAAGAAWLAMVTGGAGALLFAGVSGGLLWWWRARRSGHDPLWAAAMGLLLGLVVWNAASLARYAIPDNGDRLSSRVATWGRDHGMGPVIDRLEAVVYSEPPSKRPAGQLALATTTSTSPSTTAPPPPDTSDTDTSDPDTNDPDTSAPVVTQPGTSSTSPQQPAVPIAPAALAPVFTPPLPDEGRWVPIAAAGGADALWATSLRPLRDAGGVVATMVVIDQTHLRAGLFNGSEQPGGSWVRGNRVPDALQPSLVAAMNGGFRFEHILGGYVTEGVVAKPLRNGDATLAVGRDGRLLLGVMGRDVADDGTWLSLRQNLELIVAGGVSNVRQGIRDGVFWGADHGHEVYVKRSAVCTRHDHRLAYVLADPVDAEQLAQTLIAMGCVDAMQLDINEDWPAFATYSHEREGDGGGGGASPHFVDTRMSGNPRRYLDGSTKEFFAFFDADSVPPGSVLER